MNGGIFMALLDQIKDMARAAAEKTEVIAKSVGEKAEAALEVQKLSSAITKEQDIINKEYQKIGEHMYKALAEKGEVPEDLQESCAAITAAFAEIDVLNKKIAIIKAEKLSVNVPKMTCPECGQEVLATAKFCPECGHKIEANKDLTEIKAQIEEEKKAKVVEGEVEEAPAEEAAKADEAKEEKAAEVEDAEIKTEEKKEEK